MMPHPALNCDLSLPLIAGALLKLSSSTENTDFLLSSHLRSSSSFPSAFSPMPSRRDRDSGGLWTLRCWWGKMWSAAPPTQRRTKCCWTLASSCPLVRTSLRRSVISSMFLFSALSFFLFFFLRGVIRRTCPWIASTDLNNREKFHFGLRKHKTQFSFP